VSVTFHLLVVVPGGSLEHTFCKRKGATGLKKCKWSGGLVALKKRNERTYHTPFHQLYTHLT